MYKHRNKQGFSLVELAIGLAVITVMILAISMSAGIRDNARVQSAANSIQTLRSSAENYLVSGKLTYGGLTVKALKDAKLLPDKFTGDKANPWGGDFMVVANANNTKYDISLTGLSAEDAAKLSAYFSNNASATAFDEGTSTWTVTF